MTEDRGPHQPGLRRLLRDLLGAAAVAATLAAGLGGPLVLVAAPGRAPAPEVDGPVPADTDNVVPARADTLMYQDSLTEPLVVRSMNGVLSATLDVTIARLTVTRYGAIGPDSVLRNTLSTDTLPLRAYTLAATTDTAYRRGDPRFTPRFPGPTFRVRPGDLVQIWLRNKLPPPTASTESNTACMSYPAANSGKDVFQDCLHGPNYTNIHYHGMHVTPDSTSTVVGDDVLMAIAPGDSILYSFRIPLNQSPGTHWYHPHKHGSVALQVANGMSGAFIVEDPNTGLDRFTRQHNLREHLVAFQQVDTMVGLLHGDQFNILDKAPPLVNGQNYPVIYMAPGEVQRWRIVNENVTSNTKTLEFTFQDLPGEEPVVVEVARDGVQYAPDNIAQGSDSLLLVAAGNRLDVIVQAPAATGTHHFRVRHVPGASQRTRRPALPRRGARAAAPPVQTDTGQYDSLNFYRVFRVVVDPSRRAGSTGIPASIPNLAAFLGANIPGPPAFLGGDLPGASDTAVIVFTDTAHPGHYQRPTQFFLGSAKNPWQRFNDAVVFTPSDSGGTRMPMYLDSTQTWKIVNNTVNGINHPFHIHINPFQVDSVYAPAGAADQFYDLFQELNAASRNKTPIWLDVLPLPVPTLDSNGNIQDTAYVFITQRYDDFDCPAGNCGPPTGSFVMHCHILGHEERGMMQVLQIVDPSQPGASARGRVDAGHGAHRPAHGQNAPQRARPPVPVRKEPHRH